MHGRADLTDDQEPTSVGNTGRHRGRRPMPAPVALGLTVTALLTAFGVGAALMPGSVTGSGAPAESPAGAIAPLAPGVGGGTDPATEAGADQAATRSKAAPPASGRAPAAPGTPAKKPAAGKSPAGKLPAGKLPAGKPKPKAPQKPVVTKPRPKPKPKPKPKPVGSGQVAQENEVIRLTNVERAKHGCGKVKLNTKLRVAMRRHTQDMANQNYLDHDSKDGRSPWDRAKSAGYHTPIGENIAMGQRNAAEVMRSWMDSQGHRANILNCGAKAIGVGLSYRGSTPYWGQLFGSR